MTYCRNNIFISSSLPRYLRMHCLAHWVQPRIARNESTPQLPQLASLAIININAFCSSGLASADDILSTNSDQSSLLKAVSVGATRSGTIISVSELYMVFLPNDLLLQLPWLSSLPLPGHNLSDGFQHSRKLAWIIYQDYICYLSGGL